MRLVCRIAPWCVAALASGWGPIGVTPECGAQGTGRIKTQVTLPGIGKVRGTLRLLPPSAARWRAHGVRERFNFASPVVFSSLSDYNFDAVYGDALWSFPTLGYDPNQIGPTRFTANTLEGGIAGAPAPPANSAFAEVYYGQLGSKARLTCVTLNGGMVNLNTLAYEPGLIAIICFNGVDGHTPPQPNPAQAGYNIATTVLGDIGYAVLVPEPFPDTPPYGILDVELPPDNPVPITDAQGKFGILTAKTYDPKLGELSGGNVQWVGLTNSPNGPNRVYRLSGINNVGASGFGATVTPRSNPTDANFNQSAFGTANYFYELRGDRFEADPTPLPRGVLTGNIRRRGVNIPDGSTPESDPGFFRIAAYNASNALVREDFVFTQPSYDEFGLTDNFKLDGYPAGTYTIEVSQMPVFNAQGQDNLYWSTTLYPFSDFLPARQSVTVTDINEPPFDPTLIQVRLERFADMDNGSGNGVRDGLVDVLDLALLIFSFDSSTGDPNFRATADVAGDPAVNQGRPNGIVDVYDLSALIQMFDAGAEEVP